MVIDKAILTGDSQRRGDEIQDKVPEGGLGAQPRDPFSQLSPSDRVYVRWAALRQSREARENLRLPCSHKSHLREYGEPDRIEQLLGSVHYFTPGGVRASG
ncbi:hypothetical protein KM043_007044 [Ampulex compressa]|nr:hypothetical protein KM043_007044 [Ampulex compressa]